MEYTLLVDTAYFPDFIKNDHKKLVKHVENYVAHAQILLQQLNLFRYGVHKISVLGAIRPDKLTKYVRSSENLFHCNRKYSITDKSEREEIAGEPERYAVIIYNCFCFFDVHCCFVP
jgi:hypothetical protein